MTNRSSSIRCSTLRDNKRILDRTSRLVKTITLQILGIRSQNENLAHRKVPPQFMVELYNTIADPSGVTRGRNLYNAKVVRSFIERGNLISITLKSVLTREDQSFT